MKTANAATKCTQQRARSRRSPDRAAPATAPSRIQPTTSFAVGGGERDLSEVAPHQIELGQHARDHRQRRDAERRRHEEREDGARGALADQRLGNDEAEREADRERHEQAAGRDGRTAARPRRRTRSRSVSKPVTTSSSPTPTHATPWSRPCWTGSGGKSHAWASGQSAPNTELESSRPDPSAPITGGWPRRRASAPSACAAQSSTKSWVQKMSR